MFFAVYEKSMIELKKLKPRPTDVRVANRTQEMVMNLDSSYLREILKGALAAYVLTRSSEPISKVISDLYDIEIEAAGLVGEVITQTKDTQLRGSLASVFSFIPFDTKPKVRDVTPRQHFLAIGPEVKVQNRKLK